jgi:hypothetical protein
MRQYVNASPDLRPEIPDRRSELVGKASAWAARHPILAIMLVSLVAVTINCYPIIFCGKSYVSPTGVPIVYDQWPTLPGVKYSRPAQDHGSDSAAMMVWAAPAGFIESRTLLDHGELPLWNRYGHAGDTLIGQAVSMLGDPLHLIVILGRGSSVAWDLKFVVAKFLFCVGFGLLIRRLMESLPLALIFSSLAAYCGAFFFIYCHPAFFVFSYTPWVLLSAMAFLDLRSQNWAPWGAVWLVANFACFNAGHVELAVILIGGLNMAALAFAVANGPHLAASARIILRLGMGTLLFLALTAPMWVSFATRLQGAYSIHSEVKVVQFSPAALLGIFDDVFFRLSLKDDTFAAPAPGGSMLLAVGAIFSLLRWRQLKSEPFFWINTAAIILWAGCIFQWVPAAVLSIVPMLNRVGHTNADFSYLLILHLTIQCAYGFKCLAQERDFQRTKVTLGWVSLIFAAIVAWYCLGLWHRFAPWDYFTFAVFGAFGAPLLFAYWNSKSLVPLPAWCFIILLGFMPNIRFGLYTFGDDSLLMIPGPRVVLDAPSDAIDRVKADNSGPFRVVGTRWNLFGDYAAVYGLEDIRSCAPLSNDELVSLIRNFPGVKFFREWQLELTDPAAAQGLLNILNVKYVFASSNVDISKLPDFHLISRSDFGLIENQQAWPRAFFSDGVISIPSSDAFIRRLIENKKEPFIALTSADLQAHPELLPLAATNTAAISPATNYRLLPNATTFDIHAGSPGVVCLTESQVKDFTATANGVHKTVFTVNRAFKGIYLESPGDYHIEFIYRPRYWHASCALFWGAFAATIVFMIGYSLKSRSGKTGGQLPMGSNE